jgi:site-specific recombinase XerD
MEDARQAVIDTLLQHIDGAFAENTLKAYRSDFADFTAWCDAEGLEPWGSTATDWARYIEDREPFLSAATLRRRIHSLNSLFRLANQRPVARQLPWPTGDNYRGRSCNG